jgi:hypothetical protein
MTPIRFFITVVEDANHEVLWQASRFEKHVERAFRTSEEPDNNNVVDQQFESHLTRNARLSARGLLASLSAWDVNGYMQSVWSPG